MLQKMELYEAVVEDYTAGGEGVAKIQGCAVFVPGAIVGERCRIQIVNAKKTWASGRIVEILEKSPHRIQRLCPISSKCGGCDFHHMDYEEECRLKAQRVTDCLNRLAGESLPTVPILAAPTTVCYRNKAQYPVSVKNGRVYAGFFKAGTHEVVENKLCHILPPEMDQIKEIVLDFWNKFHLSAYNETTGKGLLRHIYVRRGALSGEILVCLVVNGTALPHSGELIRALQRVEGFTTLVLSVNTKKGNSVLGEEFLPLYGPGTVQDTLCSKTFRLSPRSFYQVNHHQAQRLYAAAIEAAQIQKTDTVLDLYCGVGTITLALSDRAGSVIGVEVIPQAVEDARENALGNGVSNVRFLCGDAGQAARQLEQEGLKPDVIVVDPPRKGLSPDCIDAMVRMAPQRIVYVSCDPATLARDVKILKEQGYRLHNAQAADLFPRCAHVESIVTLIR